MNAQLIRHCLDSADQNFCESSFSVTRRIDRACRRTAIRLVRSNTAAIRPGTCDDDWDGPDRSPWIPGGLDPLRGGRLGRRECI